MKSNSGRAVYELIFWAAVAAAAYFNRGLYKTVEASVAPIFEAYTDVVMFLIGLALFFLVMYLREAVVGTLVYMFNKVSGGSPLDYEKGDLHGNIQKSVRRLEKKGDFQGAGEAYESLEMWSDAAKVYERGNLWGKAAGAWQQSGNNGKAIELYEKDGNYEAAARICLKEGLQDRASKNFRIAADHCLQDNQFSAAAALYESSNDFNKAGSIYEQAHKADKALHCYERAGNTEKMLSLIREIPPTDYHRRGPEFTQLIERTAEALGNNGFQQEAAQILEDCNSLIRAAEVYARCKNWAKSAELYIKAERFDLAGNAINNIEDKKEASNMAASLAVQNSDWQAAGEKFEEAGKHNQAIDAYKKARNFEAAARIYESLGRYIMAGEMYSSGKNLTAAANVYAKAYDWRNAAECFEASGDTAQAIEAYANAGNYLKAGMLAIKLTDYARAIEYLQRIPPASPDFHLATGFLATAFFYQGQYDMSHELFSRVMDTLPLNRETTPVYYAYARNLEGDEPKKSLSLFRQILGVDIHYSDVSDRAQRLEQIVTSMTSNFGNNTPIPTTNSNLVRQAPLSATPPPIGATATATPSYVKTNLSTMDSSHSAAQSPPPSRTGSQAHLLDGRYHLTDPIDQNGRMTDYYAVDTQTRKEVIVRTFPRPENSTALSNTLRQLTAASHLNHAGISMLLHHGETEGGKIFCVYDRASGQTLRQWIRNNGPMSLSDVRLFTSQVLNTLSYVHSQNIYHQNLRPEIIYLKDKLEDQIVIGGFGSPSRASDSQESIYSTVPDSDPQFLAPEQIVGGRIDERTDIHALGLILFYALTGRTPFEVKRVNDTTEIARMQVQSALTRPSSIRATLPSAVDELFLKCVTKAPENRYQSAQELLHDINSLQTQATS